MITSNPGTLDEVLESLGVVVVNSGEREISCRCPFHADNHPSFSMNAENGLWICYQCGNKGTLEMLVEQFGTGDVKTTLREAKYANIDKPSVLKKEAEDDPLLLLAMYKTYKNPPLWALDERMIDREVAVRYGVKWDFGWVIPINDPHSHTLLGWQYKAPGTVMNYPRSVKKSHVLFGYAQAESGTVALVESPLDVCRLASCGVTAVASYGAFVSKIQQQLLVERADKIVLALDNDEEGQRQTARLYPFMAKIMPTTVIKYPANRKDPGDLSDAEVLEVFG